MAPAIKPAIGCAVWNWHEQFVRPHIIPIVGQIAFMSLTARQVQLLCANCLVADLSTKTAQHLHAALHQALKIPNGSK
jgi:hypothetical protein